jgi:hypothetical protein
MNSKSKTLGPCPLCGRSMHDGPSIDRHHWLPKSCGGYAADPMHRICHTKVHSLFSERELAAFYATPEQLRDHPEMRKFITWVRRMPSEYIGKNQPPRRRG